MVNKVMLIGRLGRDPELRHTASGTAVATFSLATTERYGDADGAKNERTEWHRIVAWSKLAEICGSYLKKGRLVFIEGRLQTREWDDRDGNKRRTTEIVASNMQMLESRAAAESMVADEGGMGQPISMEAGITDDDIPF
ncbi:MAG: single-stranded DNA-binding protein [Acidobacteriota bacterium]|nr:MAG: single-stranded DNA-binding protein [Acidobacteriota bacterium]